MKYISEFRNGRLAAELAAAIACRVHDDKHYRLMEFCGGHTHAIFRYGISHLLPENVEFIHGPGCPVCVLPKKRIDGLIQLLENHDGMIACTYGDVMRVPASKKRSLIKAKANGADIRMVYSVQDALDIAEKNPDREVVFFAIGFETTTPPTAAAILQAQALRLENFSVLCNHVLTPAALSALLLPTYDEPQRRRFNGILGPSHVSTIIGAQPYRFFARRYHLPIVITGFEPLDVLQATRMLVEQINRGTHTVENEYTRAVTEVGNQKAQALIHRVFEVRDTFEWRGLGMLPRSGLRIASTFAEFDTEQRFTIIASDESDVKGCECPAILRGEKKPQECRLFGSHCRPDNPLGACMVSSEGACAAYWSYGGSHTREGTS